MEEVLDILHMAQINFAELAIILFDFIGITILVVSVIKSCVKYFRHDRHTKIELAKGIALALEFKMAGEVLRTVTVRTWSELAVLGTIVVLRAAIALLIHWEIKSERADEKAEMDVMINHAQTAESDDETTPGIKNVKVKINA